MGQEKEKISACPRRIVAICVAAGFVVLASLSYRQCAEGHAGLRHWLRFGYMAALNVDLARPGEYSTSFEAHHIDPSLELEIPKNVESRMSPSELLSGLQATSQLIDPDGKVVYSGTIPADAPRVYPPGSGRICLVEYGYDTVGWHRVNVTISQPAPALKGVAHRLVVISHNTNRSARFAGRFLGHAASFIAVVILIVVAIGSLRQPNGRNHNERKAE